MEKALAVMMNLLISIILTSESSLTLHYYYIGIFKFIHRYELFHILLQRTYPRGFGVLGFWGFGVYGFKGAGFKG